MDLHSFLIPPAESARRKGPHDRIVTSSRVRLARNLKDAAFPGWAKKPERVKVLEQIRPAVQTLPEMKESFAESMDNLATLDKQILVERHLISREHAARSAGSGVVLNRDETLCVMINEEDHLRMQALRPGLQLRQAWTAIDQVDSALERRLDFAFSPDLGYVKNVDPDVAAVQIRGLWRTFAEKELGWTPYLVVATRIQTAREMQHQYVVEIRKQMGVLLLVFGVISFSVVVLVFCIFYMIVRLKRKDVGIMKSCGASSTAVAWIFLGFGITVGILGAGLGTVLGYLITVNINSIEGWIRTTFGLKLWQSSVYMFARIPNVVDWEWASILVGLSIVAAAVGTLMPAALAARTRPVEVLRYE